jgi:radical SAM protein with 4Fe4S-binding SPASM domain
MLTLENVLNEGPKMVVFAVTYKCNFKCKHCPQPELKYFPRDLNYEKIEKSLIEMKRENWNPEKFQFHFFGESLLNKNLPKLIKLTKSYFPNSITFLSTNGSYPLEEVLEAGLDQLVISIDGSQKETYEKRRIGGKFENVIDITERALKLNNRGQIIIQILRYDDSDFCALRDRFQPLLKPFDIIWGKAIGSWAGRIEEFSKYETEWMGQHCNHIGRTLVLDGDGNTTICCLDIDRKLSIGNQDKISLGIIWKSEKHKQIIKSFINNKHDQFEPCKTCYYRPEDPFAYYYMKE